MAGSRMFDLTSHALSTCHSERVRLHNLIRSLPERGLSSQGETEYRIAYRPQVAHGHRQPNGERSRAVQVFSLAITGGEYGEDQNECHKQFHTQTWKQKLKNVGGDSVEKDRVVIRKTRNGVMA
ncbi:hypothetical protein ElyMa_006729200 [Elysia marginata]|uniref:Uncharacterized protein n=1 Tax=Elysia marginata TaxID=1093978 RepID=A0AAV4IY67_9GAST|nr:hypothetical protein ElyMa_006729200 [Elysia marginata]